MGKVEEITGAMEPLQECHHDIITWYAAEDRIDILRVPDSFKGWNDFTLLFHTHEKKDGPGIFPCQYFTSRPW